jgi:hypothetical protein
MRTGISGGMGGLPIGPAFYAAIGLHTILGAGLAFVPLFNLLGYEFCVATSLLASMTAGPVAIGLVRRQPKRPVEQLWASAVWLNLISMLPALVIICLNAFRVPNCNFSIGFAFYLTLPLASAAVASAWGISLGLAIAKKRLAGLAYAGLWLGIASYNLGEAWFGSQVDSYNQLAGWIAGPIYDDVVEPGATLVLSRLHGLAWAFTMLGLTRLWTRGRDWRRSMATCAALFVAMGLWLGADRLGYGRTGNAVDQALSATTRSERFVIQHPASLSRAEARLLAMDHEFRLHQIETQLGPIEGGPFLSLVFANPSQKRALVGAGRTQYAKPWLRLMSLNTNAFPHPTLKHELVHVVAGTFGAWPFDVSARNALMINPGLTEGIAVALDLSSERFDRHTWSAALRRIGKAPPIDQLFDPVGFWKAASGRSYTLAGSFVRWLLTTYGPEPLIAAYGDGDLAGHYPKDAHGLIADWQTFLDGLEVDPGTLDVARLRFASRSVFKRKCAHELAALRKQARSLLAKSELDEADRVIDRILLHLPDDRQSLETRFFIRLAQKKPEQANAIAVDLLAREDLGQAEKARLAGRLADALVKQGATEKAAELHGRLLDAHLSDGSDRLALAKLEALGVRPVAHKILRYLDRGHADPFAPLDLIEEASARPGWGIGWYLLGRKLFNDGRFYRAQIHLYRAGQAGLAHPAMAAENLRILAISLYRSGLVSAEDDPTGERGHPQPEKARAAALATLAVMAQFPRHQGELAEVRDWMQRLHFDRTHTLNIESEGLSGSR